MTPDTPNLWIMELGNGRVRVHLAGLAHVSVPLVELRAGESYSGFPYDVWAAHLGKTVELAMLERESASDVSATVVDDSDAERQVIDRLRKRGGWLFAISTTVVSWWLLGVFAEYPYWGYGGHITLYSVMILAPLVVAWWRITFLMLSPRRPTLAGSFMGWVHMTIGLLLILFGLNAVPDSPGQSSGGVFIMSLAIAFLGAVFFEGGRSYVRLWRAEERASSSRT